MAIRSGFSRLAALLLAAAVALSASAWAAAPAAAKGDWRRGEQIYARCQTCHALQHNMVGPKHCGLIGRPAGSVPGFDYSSAMKASHIVWNDDTLDRFLANPMKVIPGTSMIYSGVPDAGQRADLIAWLGHATVSKACR